MRGSRIAVDLSAVFAIVIGIVMVINAVDNVAEGNDTAPRAKGELAPLPRRENGDSGVTGMASPVLVPWQVPRLPSGAKEAIDFAFALVCATVSEARIAHTQECPQDRLVVVGEQEGAKNVRAQSAYSCRAV